MDSVSNITTKHQQPTSPMTFVFDAANRIATYNAGEGVTTASYDANGNETGTAFSGGHGIRRTTYVYDRENRQTAAQLENGDRSTYTYAGDGLRRTEHQSGGTKTTLIWDGTDYLMEKS